MTEFEGLVFSTDKLHDAKLVLTMENKGGE